MTDQELEEIEGRLTRRQDPLLDAVILDNIECPGCAAGLPRRNDILLCRYHVTKHSHDHFRGWCYRDMASRYERSAADIATLLAEVRRLRGIATICGAVLSKYHGDHEESDCPPDIQAAFAALEGK